jgi:hypothetical protein
MKLNYDDNRINKIKHILEIGNNGLNSCKCNRNENKEKK